MNQPDIQLPNEKLIAYQLASKAEGFDETTSRKYSESIPSQRHAPRALPRPRRFAQPTTSRR